MIESACKDAADRSSTSIHRQVMSEYVLGIRGVEPCLEHCVADSERWIETSTSEVVDGAEGPEDDADRRDAPYAEIGSRCVSARHMQNEKDEDECANDLHIESCEILTQVNFCRAICELCFDFCRQEKSAGHLALEDLVITVLRISHGNDAEKGSTESATYLRGNNHNQEDKVTGPPGLATVHS